MYKIQGYDEMCNDFEFVAQSLVQVIGFCSENSLSTIFVSGVMSPLVRKKLQKRFLHCMF